MIFGAPPSARWASSAKLPFAAQARYDLGLGSIVEFSQAELQKTEADIADTDAKYQYRVSQLVLAYTIAAPK